MTFLELEKRCKKRRIKKFLLVFSGFVLLCAGAGVFYMLKNGQSKISIEKKNLKIKTTTEKHIKPKKIKPAKTEKKPQIQTLKLYIDLNITQKPEVKSIKPDKKNITNKEKNNTKTPEFIKTDVLPSFETCMKLAENYYKKGDYQKALKWARNANIQNNKKPDSWILSAKALIKLGKKQKAKEILEIYYRFSKNREAYELLRKLNE
ncbi:tetratricopeptide repeat protein [Caminibacter sp.]